MTGYLVLEPRSPEDSKLFYPQEEYFSHPGIFDDITRKRQFLKALCVPVERRRSNLRGKRTVLSQFRSSPSKREYIIYDNYFWTQLLFRHLIWHIRSDNFNQITWNKFRSIKFSNWKTFFWVPMSQKTSVVFQWYSVGDKTIEKNSHLRGELLHNQGCLVINRKIGEANVKMKTWEDDQNKKERLWAL